MRKSKKYDARGREVTTYEGHTGYVSPEIQSYFGERYMSQPIRVVPGHWPTMETKKDVDEWIKSLALFDSLFDDSDEFDKEDDL